MKPHRVSDDEDSIVPASQPTLSPVSPMCVSDLLCRELRPIQQVSSDSDIISLKCLDMASRLSPSQTYNPFDSSSSSFTGPESRNPSNSGSSSTVPESPSFTKGPESRNLLDSSFSSASDKASSSRKAPSLFDYNKTYDFPSSSQEAQSAQTNVSSWIAAADFSTSPEHGKCKSVSACIAA